VSASELRAKRRKNDVAKFLHDTGDSEEEMALARWLPHWMTALRDSWARLEEPTRQGCLERLVSHPGFESFVTVAILCNTYFSAVQANYEMENYGDRLPSTAAVEGVFLVIFSLEMLIKLALHRLYFFVNEDMAWNWFDFLLVCISIFDYILRESGMVQVSFARSMRIFKMGKVLRVFRTMRFLKELRVMLNSIMGSLVSLCWSVVMLGIILFVFALFFVQQMSAHLSDSEPFDAETELHMMQRYYFKTVQFSIATLAMCTTGGKDWETIFNLIVPLGWWSTMAFAFYIAFFTFAVMNILTGIFVENAMSLCKPNEQEALRIRRHEAEEEADELATILETLDGDMDGRMSLAEFSQVMANERVIHMFRKLGVDIKDAELFFTTVAKLSHQDVIEIPEFVAQIMRLKGQALSMDLHAVIVQLHYLEQRLDRSVEQIRLETSDLIASLGGCPPLPCIIGRTPAGAMRDQEASL